MTTSQSWTRFSQRMHQATVHQPSCMNPTVVTFTILSLIRGSQYYDGKQRCPQDRRCSMPLWKTALFFLLFSSYRRVDEWRTAGDKDASFCYPSHSWYNLLVSGLVPPSSRCRTTLHSPSWVTRETEVEATSSPSHETRQFQSVFCQKG